MAKFYKVALLCCVGSVAYSAPAFASKDVEALKSYIEKLEARIELLEERDKAKDQLIEATSKQVEKAQEEAKKATATALSKVSPSAGESSGSDVKVSLSPGPKFETADGKYSAKIGGVIQTDAAMFNDDRLDQPNGTTFRRARLNISGNITKDFKYKFENDFANNASAITDMYLEFVGFKPVGIKVGQFKEPFSLEELTSSKVVSFMERASPTAFAPARSIGLGVNTHGDTSVGDWTAALGVFGANAGTASTDDEAKSITGRLTFAPVNEEGKLLHFGVAASHRKPDNSTDLFRYRARPDTRIASAQAVDTGNITMADSVDLLGVEFAGNYGPFGLQSEYIQTTVDRNGGLSDVDLDGYYVEASYFLTGESKNYKTKEGVFDYIKPNNDFDLAAGTWGAWEIMGRFTNLDLNDVGAGITGGEMDTMTFGVRWYPNKYINFLANYAKIDTDSNAVTANDDPDVVMLRSQVVF